MKIKKMFQGTVPENKILSTYSDSQTDVYSCDYINKINTYSAEEQRIGTWLDKPLYRKTIETTTGTQSEDRTITIDNIDKPISIHGYIQIGELYIPIPYANTGAPVYTYVNSGALTLHISVDDFADKPTIITIEYTKTTD